MASRLTGQTRENVAEMVGRLARLGRNDPSIATTLGITVAQVRAIRREFEIEAGERRWLPIEARTTPETTSDEGSQE